MAASGPVNILMVDDRPQNLIALEAVLACPEFNLVRASSGGEALTKLLQDDFAVVLLDVQMPDLDGFETAKLIRQFKRSQHTPIIFITAMSGDEGFVHLGYEAGAVDYLVKPFDPFILKSKVSALAKIFRSKRH